VLASVSSAMELGSMCRSSKYERASVESCHLIVQLLVTGCGVDCVVLSSAASDGQ